MTESPTTKAQREAEYWRERCEAIIADMRDAIGSGYPGLADKTDQCSHGKFGWEDCIGCYDEFLTARLDRARKTLDEFSMQEADHAEAHRLSERRQREEALASLMPLARLEAWAKAEWERQKAGGTGCGMSEDKAVAWYLGCLSRNLSDVCAAFQIDPQAFFEFATNHSGGGKA